MAKSEIINQAVDILENGIHGGFAALVHYLYVYQKGKIRFSLVNLTVSIIIGLFMANIAYFAIPDDFLLKVPIVGSVYIVINKSFITYLVGFTSKGILDYVDSNGIGTILQMFKNSKK